MLRSFRALSLAFPMLAVSCSASPEFRAAAYLAHEVPAWPQKNKCYSCHNNGDAARALQAAGRSCFKFDARALDTTATWLHRPEGWKDNGPPGEFSDKDLATLQFAHALASSEDPGPALDQAATMLRDLQQPDGSWKVDADGLPGSPVTYGRTLATVVARRVLITAHPARHAGAIGRALRWLRQRRPEGPLDAGALLIGTEDRRDELLEILRKGQSRDGGWGPYGSSPPEVFDTSIALLGLATVREQPGVAEMIRRGRDYLLAAQEPDGSWPETTRPPGAESYAQRISTSGWALLALLATP